MRLLIRMSHALANLLQGQPLYAAFCDSLICFTADDVFFRLKFQQINALIPTLPRGPSFSPPLRFLLAQHVQEVCSYHRIIT